MIFPGSVLVPIMEAGRVPPRIQPGAPMPPVIHWYPAAGVLISGDAWLARSFCPCRY
jgi:hypothetical protein